MDNWISVKDRLPKHQESVLITDGKTVTAAEYFVWAPSMSDLAPWRAHLIDGYEWDWELDQRAVTHWMPMPPAPTPAEPK
jgi:hypothetical protein